MRSRVTTFSVVLLVLFLAHTLDVCGEEEKEKEKVAEAEEGKEEEEDVRPAGMDGEMLIEMLFGVEQKESYAKRTQEERWELLRGLAAKLDGDGNVNNVVEPQELQSRIRFNHERFYYRGINELFDRVDTDKDGKLTFEEYVKVMYPADKVPANYTEMLLYKQEKRRFEHADDDKDGILTKSDFSRYVAPENSPIMSECIIKEAIEEYDKDNDGKIHESDFLGPAILTMKLEDYDALVQKFKKELDVNGNGYLDDDEILAWMLPKLRGLHKDIAQKQTVLFFNYADLDKNNELSTEEFLRIDDIVVYNSTKARIMRQEAEKKEAERKAAAAERRAAALEKKAALKKAAEEAKESSAGKEDKEKSQTETDSQERQAENTVQQTEEEVTVEEESTESTTAKEEL